jgi:hypothetical protein
MLISIMSPEFSQNFDSNDIYSIEMPTGSYSMRYVGVNPYLYDSATGQLLPPTNNVCVDAFSCPFGIINGTATGWTADIPIAGNFGANGINGGYNAGSAGTFSVGGLFSFGNSSGGPVDVPEPASLLFFGAGAAAVIARRRKARKAA